MAKKKKTPAQPVIIDDDWRQRVRQSVRFFYDLQKLRIQMGNRTSKTGAVLTADDLEFHELRAKTLKQLERNELKQVERLCKHHPMYSWLRAQKGLGPTLAGVILAEIDIARAPTISALWKFAGLHVVHVNGKGKADKGRKGQKHEYNSFLKTKLVGVLSDCMIKAKSPWREFYDHQKNRRQNQFVDECMNCEGTGKAKIGEAKGKKCPNCAGGTKPAPWGASDGHRHRDALRQMIKMFLSALWVEWRTQAGLPVTEHYAAAYLHGGLGVHGQHAGTGARM